MYMCISKFNVRRFCGDVKLKAIKVFGGGEGSHPSELRMLVHV